MVYRPFDARVVVADWWWQMFVHEKGAYLSGNKDGIECLNS